MVWASKESGFDYQQREKLYLYTSICLQGTILNKAQGKLLHTAHPFQCDSFVALNRTVENFTMFIQFFPPAYWNLYKNYIDEDEHWPNLGTMGWAVPVSSTTKTKHQNNKMKNRTNPLDLLATAVQLHRFNCIFIVALCILKIH
jgi:hypothetical protein